MFNQADFAERYSQPEVVENKDWLRQQLNSHTIHFLHTGGKVTELPYGVKALPNELRAPGVGQLDSGHSGITWSPDKNKWVVRTTNSRKNLGYADSIAEALAMQEKDRNKQAGKEQ